MDSNNVGLLLNRPIPIKIFYLKNEQLNTKQSEDIKYEKPSLAYLSSIIQEDKKMGKDSNSDSDKKFLPLRSSCEVERGRTFISPKRSKEE